MTDPKCRYCGSPATRELRAKNILGPGVLLCENDHDIQSTPQYVYLEEPKFCPLSVAEAN